MTTRESGSQITATVLVEHGYHEVNFWYPVLRFRELGLAVTIAAPAVDQTYYSTLGYPVIPETSLSSAAALNADVLVVPGGEAGRRLSASPEAAELVRNHLGGSGRTAITGTFDELAALTGGADPGRAATIVASATPDDLPALLPSLLGPSLRPPEPHLSGARILVLAESQYQELELWYPVLRFRESGADVAVASPARGGLYASKIGYPVRSDVSVSEIDPTDIDALVIPGGFAPEGMRRSEPLLDLVRKTYENGTIVAAICHAGWVLISAGIARGRRLTCVPIIRDDLLSAGADYTDAAVVRDGNLITSRLPNDLPDFCAQIALALGERRQPGGDGHSWPAAEDRLSTAAYSIPAELVMSPGGTATANYRVISALADSSQARRIDGGPAGS
jgi:protease I